MSESATEIVKKGMPWRRGIPWWVVDIEGIVILAVGVYLIWASDEAREIVRQLIAGILFISSVSIIWGALRNRGSVAAEFQAMRGGIGLAVGAIVVLANWSNYLADDAERRILGVGLLTYALLGIVAIYIAFRADEPQASSGPITAALTLVFGIILLTGGHETAGTRIQWLGGLAILIGVALNLYALWIRSGEVEGSTTAARHHSS